MLYEITVGNNDVLSANKEQFDLIRNFIISLKSAENFLPFQLNIETNIGYQKSKTTLNGVPISYAFKSIHIHSLTDEDDLKQLSEEVLFEIIRSMTSDVSIRNKNVIIKLEDSTTDESSFYFNGLLYESNKKTLNILLDLFDKITMAKYVHKEDLNDYILVIA